MFKDINSEIKERGEVAGLDFGKSYCSSFGDSTQIFTLELNNQQQTKKGFRIKKMALLRKKTATSRILEVYRRVKIQPQVKTSPCSLNPDPRKPRKQKKHLRLKRSNALPSLKRKVQMLQTLHPAFNC